VPPETFLPQATIGPSALRAAKAWLFTKIYSNGYAFAALKADGSITAWGDENNGGEGAPRGNGYVKIYSTYGAFAHHDIGHPKP
jgi:hypothetical protein